MLVEVSGGMTDAFAVELRDDDLVYYHHPAMEKPRESTVRPTAKEWASFRRSVETTGALSWRGAFKPEPEAMVTDAVSWSVNLRWQDGEEVSCQGYQVFPPSGDSWSPGPEWNRFCRAVSRLVEGQEFAWQTAARRTADTRGSRRQIREWVCERRQEFEDALAESSSTFRVQLTSSVNWIAPHATDGLHEYRDELWNMLASTSPQKDGFWPARGPVWDAAGHVPVEGALGAVLVEAKSHVGELRSSPTAASGESLETIERALYETKTALGIDPKAPWTGAYYQLANRLAMLHWLRNHADVDAWLFNVYFLGDRFASGDRTIMGPPTVSAWQTEIARAKDVLQIPDNHALVPYAIDVFLPAVPLVAGVDPVG